MKVDHGDPVSTPQERVKRGILINNFVSNIPVVKIIPVIEPDDSQAATNQQNMTKSTYQPDPEDTNHLAEAYFSAMVCCISYE
jgi:antitoxin (DNA-binding transcriptional repressor) of toxin-antitoxin stability system